MFLAFTTCIPTYALAASPAPQVMVPSRATSSVAQFRHQEMEGLGAALAYGSLRARTEQWMNLPADWDGEGGRPLSQSTCDSAISFLGKCQGAGLPTPKPFVAGDGEVGFTWETASGLAAVSFLADGHIVGKVPTADGKAFRIDELYSPLADIDGLLSALTKARGA